MNTKLILRSTKSIEITPKGMELYNAAENIHAIKDDLMRRWANEDQHIIRIGASTLPSAYILPEILPEFSRLYPNTYFIINQGDSADVISQVLEDQCDWGLIGMETNEKHLECIPFYEDHMVIITPVNEHFLTLKNQKGFGYKTIIARTDYLKRGRQWDQKECGFILRIHGNH